MVKLKISPPNSPKSRKKTKSNGSNTSSTVSHQQIEREAGFTRTWSLRSKSELKNKTKHGKGRPVISRPISLTKISDLTREPAWVSRDDIQRSRDLVASSTTSSFSNMEDMFDSRTHGNLYGLRPRSMFPDYYYAPPAYPFLEVLCLVC